MIDQATEVREASPEVTWKIYGQDEVPGVVKRTLDETLKQRVTTLVGEVRSLRSGNNIADQEFIDDIAEDLDEMDTQVDDFKHLFDYIRGKDKVKLPMSEKYLSDIRPNRENKDRLIISLKDVRNLPVTEESKPTNSSAQDTPFERTPDDELNQALTVILMHFDNLSENEELTTNMAQQFRDSTRRIRDVLGINPALEPAVSA